MFISCNFYKSYDAFLRQLMSFQIVKVKGIPVRLHFTLIIVFFLVAWTLASSFMPQYFPNLATVQYWIMGAIGAIILFISVFLHELMHSVIALRYGIKVRQIILQNGSYWPQNKSLKEFYCMALLSTPCLEDSI